MIKFLVQLILGILCLTLAAGEAIVTFCKHNRILALVFTFFLWVNSLSLPLPDEFISAPQSTPVVVTGATGIGREQALRISGGDGLPIRLLRKRKKIDFVLHTRLMKTFPDWNGRMEYQKKQEEHYKSALKKQSELTKLRIKNTSGVYTKEERNAINYFHGKGFYVKQQDPSTPPNVFDTRQSFLLKMHNPSMPKNFVKSFKRLNSLDD